MQNFIHFLLRAILILKIDWKRREYNFYTGMKGITSCIFILFASASFPNMNAEAVPVHLLLNLWRKFVSW